MVGAVLFEARQLLTFGGGCAGSPWGAILLAILLAFLFGCCCGGFFALLVVSSNCRRLLQGSSAQCWLRSGLHLRQP